MQPQSQVQQQQHLSTSSHTTSTSNSPVDHVIDVNSSVGNANRSTSQQPPQAHLYIEPQAYKLRRALQHKESQQAERNIVRIASGGVQRPSSPRDKPALQNWPFDYVKNKIVEEMHRTSDEDGNKNSNNKNNAAPSAGSSGVTEEGSSDQHNQQSYLPASNYAYPYSSLNINSQVPVSAHTTPTINPKPVDVLEPTPILSSQYEPLSDED